MHTTSHTSLHVYHAELPFSSAIFMRTVFFTMKYRTQQPPMNLFLEVKKVFTIINLEIFFKRWCQIERRLLS